MLQKTDAVVLSKLDYSETSKIASFYSREFGRISGIIKGGRSSNSKIGRLIDPLNVVEIVLIQKDSRELQSITNASLVSYHKSIHSDFDSIKYASAVVELVRRFTPEHDTNHRLYSGIKRILERMESAVENPAISFYRFLVFFFDSCGFGMQLENCVECGEEIVNEGGLFDIARGVVCRNCAKKNELFRELTTELYLTLISLIKGKNVADDQALLRELHYLLNEYAKHHLHNYNGLRSLEL